jgi:cytochrome c oxidase cbb3-type subunit I/II
MWKNFEESGRLAYTFLETTTQILDLHMLRSVGGTLYLAGVFVMVYNMVKTVKSGRFQPTEEAQAPALSRSVPTGEFWHRVWERKPVFFTVMVLIAILIGGLVEFVPAFLIKSNVPSIEQVKPYTALELAGRDIYIREGCVGCHSQMVRPFRHETERYGEYSKAGEFVYDHPFLWGSKRTGPDLHRLGAKYPDAWHYQHMMEPASMSPGSIMPRYPWLAEGDLDTASLRPKIKAMQQLGVPYPEGYAEQAGADAMAQAETIQENLEKTKIQVDAQTDMVALIAYLQRLGTDIKLKSPLKTASK